MAVKQCAPPPVACAPNHAWLDTASGAAFSRPSFGLTESFPPVHTRSVVFPLSSTQLSPLFQEAANQCFTQRIKPSSTPPCFSRKDRHNLEDTERASIMAIKNNAVRVTARSWDDEMTTEEFKVWLKSFDTNKDGRISRDELRRAIRSIRVRFSGWKSKRGVQYADSNGDGFIDDDEIDNLVEYAQKNLGLKIVAY